MNNTARCIVRYGNGMNVVIVYARRIRIRKIQPYLKLFVFDVN